MAKKIIDEAPSKLSVFFSHNDVKAAAAWVHLFVVHFNNVGLILSRMDLTVTKLTIRQDLGLAVATKTLRLL